MSFSHSQGYDVFFSFSTSPTANSLVLGICTQERSPNPGILSKSGTSSCGAGPKQPSNCGTEGKFIPFPPSWIQMESVPMRP